MSLPEFHWVFDTNAIISALLVKQSVPGKAFDAALVSGTILLSEATFSELAEVLARKKFDRYLTREERDHVLTMLVDVGLIVEIVDTITECRDRKDDKFLELAISGHASCLISGDPDLLVLNPFRGVPILTPLQFLDWLSKKDAER